MIKGVLIGALGVVLVTFVVWFGFGKVLMFWELNSLFPARWYEVHMTDGQVWYGNLSGVNQDHIRLINVRYLEKYTRSITGSEASSGMTSGEFSLGGGVAPGAIEEKYVLVGKNMPVYLNRAMVLYWHVVDPSSPASRYLK